MAKGNTEGRIEMKTEGEIQCPLKGIKGSSNKKIWVCDKYLFGSIKFLISSASTKKISGQKHH